MCYVVQSRGTDIIMGNISVCFQSRFEARQYLCIPCLARRGDIIYHS